MNRINIHEAKTHLSKYLDRLKPGKPIILCRRNVPVAEIRALTNSGESKRTIGLAKDSFRVPASFFEPLPDDLIDAFNE